MAEVYRVKAASSWAGSYCDVKKCTNYARFVVSVFNTAEKGKGFCGHHLSTGCKGMHALDEKALVVQEVPGNWGAELVVFDGEVVNLPPGDRKR